MGLGFVVEDKPTELSCVFVLPPFSSKQGTFLEAPTTVQTPNSNGYQSLTTEGERNHHFLIS